MTTNAKSVANMLLGISFGLSLIFVGLTHYMQFEGFQAMTMDGLGPVSVLGMIWSYIYPALLIVGGALMLIGRYMWVSAWLVGLGLGSVPAGMLLKSVLSGIGLSETMPPAINAFIWLLVFVWIMKFSGHGHGCKGGCGCGDAKPAAPMMKK